MSQGNESYGRYTFCEYKQLRSCLNLIKTDIGTGDQKRDHYFGPIRNIKDNIWQTNHSIWHAKEP